MRILRSLLFSALLILSVPPLALAQTTGSHLVTIIISPIAALNHVGGNITLTIVAPAVGGQAASNPTNNTGYLQYTSSVLTGGSRGISAAWGGSDAAPAGCSLTLDASSSGRPGEGSSTGLKTISGTAQNIITGITRCATGVGATDGTRLTYTLAIDSFTSLRSGENRLATITFILADIS